MKTPLSRLALVFTGLALSLSFAACDNRDVVAASATEESSATGKVAFRLSDTLLQVVKQTSDSVRIEAVREGFTTRTVAGSIGGITHLSNLEPGAWTLKIATYDTLRAVSWYGETLVQIKAGSTVDAVVVLRRASGSVNVHIVLDTLPTAVDTARQTVKPTTGTLPGYLPILRSWRSDSGIFILTSFYCQAVVVRQIPDSGTVFRFGSDPDIRIKCLAGTPAPVVIFVPWKNCGNVTLLDANGKGGVLSAPSCFPTEPAIDTVTVPYIQGNASGYQGIPVDSAWRGANGIYIATHYDYFTPVVVAKPTETRYPREIVLVGKPTVDKMARKNLPHVVFVPFPSDWPVGVGNLLNDGVIQLPGKPIIVDPPSVVDTVTVKWIEGNPGDSTIYKPLPVEGAWRTDKGIFIATRYDYFQPVVVHSPMQSSRPRRLYLVGTPINTLVAVKLLPHIVFVPFPADEDVIVSDLANKSVFQLPGNRDVVPVKDSSFTQYSLTVKGTSTALYESIVLKADGSVTRESHLGPGVVDSGPRFQSIALSKDTLALLRAILEQPSSRHPGGLPTITDATCPAGAPYNNRYITYANGTSSSMFWTLSSYCGDYPASWQVLDQVDAILRRSFMVLPVATEPAQ